MITGADVKAKREQLKLSRQDFAQKCHLTAAKLWRIETKNEFKPGEEAAILKEFFDDFQVIDKIFNIKDPVITDDAKLTEAMTDADIAQDINFFGMPQPIKIIKGGLTFPVENSIVQAAGWCAPADHVPVQVKNDPVFDTTTNRYISHSEIATFQDCPRKWRFAYHMGLQPLEVKPIGALAMGTRVHKALEAYYTPEGVKSQDPRDVLAKLIMTDWTTLVMSYSQKFEAVPPEVKKKFDTEAKMQKIMIEGYLEWIASEGTDSNYKTIEPERYIEVDAGVWHDGRGTKYVGRVDRLVRRMTDDALLFEDFKTAASIPALVKVLPINTQMKHYLMLLDAEDNTSPYMKVAPRGALYTILRKSMQSQTSTPPFYARVEVYHNKIEKANYRKAVDVVTKQIQAAEVDLTLGIDHHHVTPPRPSGDCSWKCPFFQICPMSDDGSAVESMIENHFQVGDPLHYYNPAKKETE